MNNISFVIPAYNCADTIVESVDSIIDGNFEDGDELIIINDCSSDDTDRKIKFLKEKHPFIIYLKNNENKGCPATRNIGIRSAKNDLIFNLDSDNVLDCGSIKKLKDYLLSEDADIAAFSEYHFFEKDIKKITHKWVYPYKNLTLSDFLAGPINPGPGGNFLFTKESWERIGGYWEYGKGLHEAWGFTLKQLANNSKFVVLPGSYYFHRYGHESLFARESKKADESSLMATKMVMNFIDLVDDDDAEYIKSEDGSKTWFENFSNRPIKLKNNNLGVTGMLIELKNKKSFILRCVSFSVSVIRRIVNKLK